MKLLLQCPTCDGVFIVHSGPIEYLNGSQIIELIATAIDHKCTGDK